MNSLKSLITDEKTQVSEAEVTGANGNQIYILYESDFRDCNKITELVVL